MTCERCDLHIKYLERIITLQKQEIEYFKTILSNNYNNVSTPQKINNVDICLYDIIDFKITEIDILEKLKAAYPAKKELKYILKFVLIDKKYNMMCVDKKLITYLDSDNFEKKTDIEDFSENVCSYIFNKIKPIIEHDTENSLTCESDFAELYNNYRVKNLMMLKESKFYLPIMKEIIKTV